jgi:hypothetical protein
VVVDVIVIASKAKQSRAGIEIALSLRSSQ